ncbi:TPA: PRTRC system ParB family protein [Pseudomonas aeruginosa]|nr:PRTRC system ParB family protein [Pseudomonas aeruginosa]
MSTAEVLQINQAQEPVDEMRMLAARRIRRNPAIDPRISRNSTKYRNLSSDIAARGIDQPILVRPIQGEPDFDFEIVAGNTRHAITLELNLELIPARIRSMTDMEARVASLQENTQRADLTPLEEAKHVLSVLNDYQNDHDAVCKALGWSITKLRSRILLSHCNVDVAEALAQEQIKIGHAELLATTPPEHQTAVLAKIIAGNMTVMETQKRMFELSRDLATAKFDCTECQGCPKNSATARDLFDTSLDGAKCLDVSCWDSKASALVQAKIVEASAEYGVVHTDLTIPPKSFVQLEVRGEKGVGDDQYRACTGCQSYGAVVSTRPGNEGVIQGGMCFNRECNTSMRQQYQQVLAKLNAPVLIATDGPSTTQGQEQAGQPQAGKAPAATTAKPAQPAGMRKGIRRHAFGLYAGMAEKAITSDVRLVMAVAITSLYFDMRGELSVEARGKAEMLLGVTTMTQRSSRSSLETLLAAKTVEELNQLMQSIAGLTVYRTDSADQFERSMSGSQSLAFIQHAGLQTKDHFLMNEEFLKTLTKAGVIEECRRSGFEAKYNQVLGDKAFKQLTGQGAGQLIAQVIAFTDFDWKGYVPQSMEISAQSTGTVQVG